ncbi:protein SUPPRESSOR OF GENE SILENCING 3 [Diospyros lotus]|uniref:protein SUPPRESSOR OF GENE SILENCING 3 n=1 Tax=Diospyros lotus TaxID=55363 RepID=UPI00225855D4|nr:protein SUPPRESSOR OF GENE SILENCING 3 [Diospyros lotus]XP_052192936.1 protein SUPPRESSOR OF GENE SILENCING 3 [Diospyros lotus]XP_052192937.1 protein SUPPRESSOR OF GENE SILENCING 3 [Diospyros lotus]XP_052192938.1 protein SUPPRESSOR OF GENE SILENCING 3 [Diospyros lotus]
MSNKGSGKSFIAGTANSSSMGKGISGDSSQKVDQLSHGVEDISLDSAQDGEWEVYEKKAKHRSGSNASRSSSSHGHNPKPWGHPDVQKSGMWNSGWEKGPGNSRPMPNTDSRRSSTRVNFRPQSSSGNLTAGQPVIPPPLQQGWNWRARAAASQPAEEGANKRESDLDHHGGDSDDDRTENNEGDSDAIDDTDDELLSDEFDSDASQKSHETLKKSNWFKSFFQMLDKLSVDEINEPARQWHCPACQRGPGAIDWYRGLQPLMTHAKTKGSARMKVHREFAELLDEELSRRGTSVIPAGEEFGKWKGLSGTVSDHDIIWPPMVVIMNTRLNLDDNEKWTGMGNQELLNYFSSYAAVKARHSYGPQGHRGMSVLIFENSAIGYLEAERLHSHFKEEGTDREAWERNRVLFRPGGQRQLFGYMAEKRDLDNFNLHSQGKSKLKFEIKSYQEMVVNQMKRMSEDNQQLIWFKNKVAKEQMRSKALQESFGSVSEKLRRTLEENRIVKERSKMHHEQNKEEMDFQEQFFKDQLKIIHEARDAKEDDFEKIQQEEREKVKQSNANLSSTEDRRRRADEITKFVKSQDKEMEEFVAERDRLFAAHKEEMIAMKKRHWEEEVELEKKFDAELNQLMEKYAPH